LVQNFNSAENFVVNSEEDNLRSFWNTWDKEHLETRKLDSAGNCRGQEALILLRSLSLTRPQILEVGCANGWLAVQLVELGEVTAVDIADEVIARAKDRFPSVKFLAGDFTEMSDFKRDFDVVVVLETIGNVTDHKVFVAKIIEALKPGGHLILSCQNKFVFERREDIGAPPPGQVRNWLDRPALRRLLKDQFQLKKLYTILPAGHIGILRYCNSYKLDSVARKLRLFVALTRLREWLGLGQSILVLAILK
jgi:2-polyprenyl-3-methyl-5-hydroxy-6-metoxy-1,4-benzoquinol methylase